MPGIREISDQNDSSGRKIWDGRCRERSERGHLQQLRQAWTVCCCLSPSAGLWGENLRDGPCGLMGFHPCGISRLFSSRKFFFPRKTFCCVPGCVFLIWVSVVHTAGWAGALTLLCGPGQHRPAAGAALPSGWLPRCCAEQIPQALLPREDVSGFPALPHLCACPGRGSVVRLWFLAWSWDTKPGGSRLNGCTQGLSRLSSKKKLHVRAQAAGTSRDKILSVESRPSIRINIADAVIYGAKMKV